jgi:hypothetical protein
MHQTSIGKPVAEQALQKQINRPRENVDSHRGVVVVAFQVSHMSLETLPTVKQVAASHFAQESN